MVASALLYVGVSSYQELTQEGFPDQSSTAVASTLRLPARFDSIHSIEYGPTWEHVGFVMSYSIEYEKHCVVSK